jgi:pimeloyl-[acyl-carrier protein] methyl ester esterase
MPPLPPWVLLPGLDGTATLFEPFLEALGPHRPAQAVAYPGDRVLDYDALERFVRQRLPSEGPFLVLGESFSGPLAIRLAADPPRGLAGVMLVASFASSPVRIPGWLGRALAPALASGHPPIALMSRRLLGDDPPPGLRDALDRAVRSVSPTVLAARQLAVLEVDVRPLLARVGVPLGYLQAGQDRAVPRRSARAIAARYPQLWLERIPGPHLLLQRQPVACAAALEQWWSALTEAAGALDGAP